MLCTLTKALGCGCISALLCTSFICSSIIIISFQFFWALLASSRHVFAWNNNWSEIIKRLVSQTKTTRTGKISKNNCVQKRIIGKDLFQVKSSLKLCWYSMLVLTWISKQQKPGRFFKESYSVLNRWYLSIELRTARTLRIVEKRKYSNSLNRLAGLSNKREPPQPSRGSQLGERSKQASKLQCV